MNKENIIEIIRFLKPKFYNRLTWLVVISGLGILTKPFLLEFLNNLFEANWNFSITGKYDELIGFGLVCVGLVYNVIINRKPDLKLEEEKEKKGHDKEIFLRLNNLLAEDFLHDMLDTLLGGESISRESTRKINDFLRVSKLQLNQYLISDLEKAKKEFVKDLRHLKDFVNTEFFSHQNPSVDALVMRPELNIDRGGAYSEENEEKHRDLSLELSNRGFTAEKSFKEYRSKIKKKLKV